MKFQTGDKVIVKHTGEEAEVIDIINNKMVMLDVSGVRFPAYIDQLEYPYFRRFSEKKLFPEKKEKKSIENLKKEKSGLAEKKEDGVWLTIVPVMHPDEFGDEVVETLKLHLVNRTRAGYLFEYQVKAAGKKEFGLTNQVHPFEDFYLHDMPFSDLNDNPLFHFDFFLSVPLREKADHYEASLRLKPRQLFARIEELKVKGEGTFSHKLFDTYPDKTEPLEFDLSPLAVRGYKMYEASHARRHLEPAQSVLDLHIEKLTSDHEKLTPLEKLSLQLSRFEKNLELAIAHHLASMIVIHGVGTGKLRDEIHEILRMRKEVKTFMNRYHPAYGYGATEILFQY